MLYIYVYASKTRRYARVVGASSLSAAGGSAGLVEAHSFAQPASKVHFLHFRSFDERVTLKENQRKSSVCAYCNHHQHINNAAMKLLDE